MGIDLYLKLAVPAYDWLTAKEVLNWMGITVKEGEFQACIAREVFAPFQAAQYRDHRLFALYREGVKFHDIDEYGYESYKQFGHLHPFFGHTADHVCLGRRWGWSYTVEGVLGQDMDYSGELDHEQTQLFLSRVRWPWGPMPAHLRALVDIAYWG